MCLHFPQRREILLNTESAMKTKQCKTPEEVKREFVDSGLSIAAWSRENNVSAAATYRVLRDPSQATRGDCHRAAVLLGLKAGKVVQQNQGAK
jgi:gp16 family phage-associated protein